MRHLTIVAICGVFFLSTGCDRSPRIDASTDEALKTSLEKMSSEMTQDQRNQFDDDCMDVLYPSGAWEGIRTLLKMNKPGVLKPKSTIFKPLQGLTVAEIHCKAEEIRARREPKDKLAPITEADMISAVTDSVKLSKLGGNQSDLKGVKLLSALIEPSKQYFENNKSYELGSTAACYVLIEYELKTDRDRVWSTDSFVIVTRDTGRNFPAQRGKLAVVMYNGDERVIKSTLGAEWLAQHPRPEIPKRP